LRDILLDISAATGEAYLRTLARHLAKTVDVDYVFFSEILGHQPESLRSLAIWEIDRLLDAGELPDHPAPCLGIIREVPSPITLPETSLDYPLASGRVLRLRGYLGIPLIAASGKLLGTLAIASRRPLTKVPQARFLLEYFTHKTVVELEHRRNLRTRNDQLRFLESLGNTLPTPIYYKDIKGRYLGCNQAFIQLLGRSRGEIVGKTAHQLWPRELAQHFQTTDLALLNNGGVQTFEHTISMGGNTRDMIFHKAIFFDDLGTPAGIVGTLIDITERRQAERRIEQLAYFDALTGLPNRLRLQQHLEQLLERSRRENRMIGLLFLDQDRFKKINDTLGYAAGSRALQAIAAKLTHFLDQLPDLDDRLVARVGGDKFALAVYPLADKNLAGELASRLLDLLTAPLQLADQVITCNGSVGIAISPDDGTTVDSLLENADSAMYQTKRNGRGSWQYYSPEISLQDLEQLTLESDLRGAIQRNELFLHYQPQLDLATGRISGAEALLRWRHPRLGMVPPDRFVHLAEETGQIVALGEWVLRTACRQNRDWQRQGLPPIQVAVNLSGHQLLQPRFTTLVKTILEETELDPTLLELELTESTIMKNPEDIRILRELKELGVQLAIDDFGTGYSSLAYLKRFPLNRLKIDRSFISHLTNDPEDEAIVEAILAMARRLGLNVLAEGVETAEQLDFLAQRECGHVQGYYLGRPMPADDIVPFILNPSIVNTPAGRS
jgi:diguanylate cyclase (GGDEF)-like protein/PAS domain S-box-containing protein